MISIERVDNDRSYIFLPCSRKRGRRFNSIVLIKSPVDSTKSAGDFLYDGGVMRRDDENVAENAHEWGEYNRRVCL